MYNQNCVENSGKVIMHWTLPKQVIGFFKVVSTYRLSVMAYVRNFGQRATVTNEELKY